MLFEISAAMAFFQGIASFASPCVLPLLPAYLSYLSGSALDAIDKHRGILIRNACFYVLGFTLVFVAMGATATALGSFLQRHADVIRMVSGGLLVLFGLAMLVQPAFLQRERRIDYQAGKVGILQALLTGMVFAFGWSPCIGPVLTSVLMMAASSASMWQGVGLLLLYSLGMGLPFLLIALFLHALKKPLGLLKKHMPVIRAVSAALFIVMGVLMLTNTFMLLAGL